MPPKIPKDPDDEGNVDSTKPPEPKVNQKKWQYVKPKFVEPGWEYIKRADFLSLVEVFEMFFGKGKVSNNDLEYLDWGDSPPQPDCDIYKLFGVAIIQGYFGDSVRRYTPLSSCPLPTDKVFSFIKEKGITDLLRSYGYEIHSGFQELIKHFSIKGKSEPELVSQPQVEPTKDSPENYFEPDGQDNWRITFMKKELGLIKDSDGMRYISIILKNRPNLIGSQHLYGFNPTPERGVNAKDIIKTIKAKDEGFLDSEGKLSGIAHQHLGQETIDENYLEDLKKAQKELKEAIDTIKQGNYLGDSSLENELHNKEDKLKTLNDFMKKSMKPERGTRKAVPTTFDSEAKDASGKIQHALKTAYENIQKESPELAEHLKGSIKRKNNQFSYNPPSDSLVDWEVTLK